MCVTNVVRTAIAIPSMPRRLPRRLLSGFDRPRSARMKQTPAIRYARRTQAGCACAASSILALLLLVHCEHSGRDGEAAEDVYARKRNGDEAEPLRRGAACRSRSDQRTHDDD